MNTKERATRFLIKLFELLKPLAGAVIVIAILQATGLISSVSHFTQWALLQTGFKDADTESDGDEEIFRYDFNIKDLKGNRISFEKYKGKVVFLNLWATWCGPCRAEMPGIQKLYEKADTSKVAFVMLSLDKDGDVKKVISYMQKSGYTFEAFMPSGYLPEQLQVPLIPTTFVISRSGKVELKQVGSKRYDTSKFQNFLQKIIDS